jgi:hypothetical protein
MNRETPEFYLVLRNVDLSDALADSVYEAGFDDSLLTMRGGRAAIWVTDRPGELTELVRDALAQAKTGGLSVSHVEIENEVFA